MGKSSKKQEAEQLRAYRLSKQQEEQAKKEQQKKKQRVMICIIAAVLAVALIGTGVGVWYIFWEGPAGAYVQLTVAYTDRNGEETQGTIVIKTLPKVAPVTAENFQKLVSEGFYDGLTFHRVMSGFMIQGGDPDGDGTGGAENTIIGEFSANGYTNRLSHKRGVISMARSSSYNSASSQFFIMHGDASSSLDGNYAAFGRVVEGMETVDGIAGTEVKYNSTGDEKSVPVHTVTLVKAVILENYK